MALWFRAELCGFLYDKKRIKPHIQKIIRSVTYDLNSNEVSYVLIEGSSYADSLERIKDIEDDDCNAYAHIDTVD
ncbi:hypothetical protein GOP47_0024524 [Adiantum capillus-veneris]|uniref:Uncharacterized protein n=1 Tax=Adiantum capillus-veneris TaxID=13818 RepID=A0A9D4U483_ADICA|nr:hypothetical protein GOP47_0024524 [Adiantum capillus-veneris]